MNLCYSIVFSSLLFLRLTISHANLLQEAQLLLRKSFSFLESNRRLNCSITGRQQSANLSGPEADAMLITEAVRLTKVWIDECIKISNDLAL